MKKRERLGRMNFVVFAETEPGADPIYEVQCKDAGRGLESKGRSIFQPLAVMEAHLGIGLARIQKGMPSRFPPPREAATDDFLAEFFLLMSRTAREVKRLESLARKKKRAKKT
jgi:hypothetical protein